MGNRNVMLTPLTPTKGGENMTSYYCRYLERICNLRSLSARSKRQIVDRFLAVRSEQELRQLCESIQDRLRPIAVNPDYFTV